MGFSKTDLAKYPFINEATEYIKQLDISLDELKSGEFEQVLLRAEKRLEEAITIGKISKEWKNDDLEILSFPIALMILAFIGDEKSRNRHALSESKRAYDFLKNEPIEKILEISKNTFKWNVRIDGEKIFGKTFDAAIHFKDYLRNSTPMRELRWKLTNRILNKGYVYLTKEELSRLLSEEVRRKVLEKTSLPIKELPEALKSIAFKIKDSLIKKGVPIIIDTLPRNIVLAAMPPCIKSLYEGLISGRHIPHMGRFALTSFLINVGIKEDEVIKIFMDITDFDERKTRYQVEHIAGIRGSKIKYVPPKCTTLKTHGLCTQPDQICIRIKHPVRYYKVKVKQLSRKEKVARSG
ncbi:MAG: DNA primase large subunit PriL [Candidatus Bathyarchaeia archaeon]